MPTCSTCSTDKPVSEFYIDRSREDGHTTKCKVCTLAYNKAWREGRLPPRGDDWKKKTADMKVYQKQRYELNKDKIRGVDKGGVKRTPEQERERYVAKMIKKHGQDWKPSKQGLNPYLTDEQRAASKKRTADKRLERRRTDPVVHAKLIVRKKVARAVKSGRLVKLPCLMCGSTEVEAHHPSYALPLAVTWLCKDHHNEVHNPVPSRA
jgi:hypothetical protein